MKKRLLALLLAVVMVAAMIPASVFAEDELQTDAFAKWAYEYEYYMTKDGDYVRAIKAKKHDDVQYLYAVVNGDLVYDGTAVDFVGDKTTDLANYVTFKVDTYDDDKFESSKTLVKDKGLDWQNFTTTFAEFKGEGYNAITAWFEYEDEENEGEIAYEPTDVGEYSARFTIDAVEIEAPIWCWWIDDAKTEFDITPKSINDAEDIVLDEEALVYYHKLKDTDITSKDLNIILTDVRIEDEEGNYYVLVEGKDYVVTFEGFVSGQEYLQDNLLVVKVTGIGNYEESFTFEVMIEKPIVSFDANGGTPDSATKVDYNTAVAKPQDPTREGYKFAGWYYDKEGTVAYDFETLVVEDTQLYAKWVANVDTGVTTGSNMTLIIAGSMILLAAALAVVVLKKRASQK